MALEKRGEVKEARGRILCAPVTIRPQYPASVYEDDSPADWRKGLNGWDWAKKGGTRGIARYGPRASAVRPHNGNGAAGRRFPFLAAAAAGAAIALTAWAVATINHTTPLFDATE